MNVAVVLVAGGSGRRLGAEIPKAFCSVASKTLVEYAYARFVDHPGIRDVVLVAPVSWVAQAQTLAPGAAVVAGGSTRQASVAAGLAALGADVDAVLVHDVARPFVPTEVVSRVIAALESGAVAVIPVLAVTDTIKRVDGDRVLETVERGPLRAVQTPQ